MQQQLDVPFLITLPHSGEKIPEIASWLKGLPETLLMCDVDRYVDLLYAPALEALNLPSVKTEWHRYAGDLNRLPTDVDASSVIGHHNSAGLFKRGFLWTITTTEEVLMKTPISAADHQKLIELIYQPFHQKIKDLYKGKSTNGSSTNCLPSGCAFNAFTRNSST
jgi:N-formylglutamate deformylase